MAWTIEITREFESWWEGLNEDERVSIDGMIHVLEAHDPSLGVPFSVPVAGSHYTPQLCQLLVPHDGRQICVLYISDEQRSCLVLLAGTTAETADSICPPDVIARADASYARYLAQQHAE